jgi:alpha-tubulin suppressor-like RCC1 family protein
MALGIALGACGWTSGGPGPRVPARLVFGVQPTLTESGLPLTPAVTIEVRDVFGVTVANATNTVTVAIGSNPSGAALSGTTSAPAVRGVATFDNLLIDGIGTGYTLTAMALGLSATTSLPFEIRRTFVTVSAGARHSCAVTAAGAAYCWGDNSYGQLGDGTTSQRRTPVAVSGGLTFAMVSAGGNHTCGVTKAMRAYCWGLNDYGQLGAVISTGPPETCPPLVTCSTTPVAVFGALAFAAVSAGTHHTCGVTTTGAAYCWGANDTGQLGDGTMTGRISPTPVRGGLTFVTASAGGAHSCGITTAGAACWGDNSHGQLGVGTTTGQLSPMSVAGGYAFTTVSAGSNHTCGVTATGVALCWGDNQYGEFGKRDD